MERNVPESIEQRVSERGRTVEYPGGPGTWAKRSGSVVSQSDVITANWSESQKKDKDHHRRITRPNAATLRGLGKPKNLRLDTHPSGRGMHSAAVFSDGAREEECSPLPAILRSSLSLQDCTRLFPFLFSFLSAGRRESFQVIRMSNPDERVRQSGDPEQAEGETAPPRSSCHTILLLRGPRVQGKIRLSISGLPWNIP